MDKPITLIDSAERPFGTIRKVFELACPFGRRKLALVFFLSLLQGIVQVVGVTSIFPFLALASDPQAFRDSSLGQFSIDHLPPLTDFQYLLVAGLFSAAMLLLSNGINVLAEWNRMHYVYRFGHWLRIKLLRSILTQPYGYFLTQNSGVLHKKVASDVMQYTTGLLLPMLDASARLVTVLLLVVTLFFVDAVVAFSALLFVGGFYAIVYVLLANVRGRISSGIKDLNRRMNVELLQILTGIKPIKVHRSEEHFLRSFSQNSADLARLLPGVTLCGTVPRYVIEPFIFGGLVIYVLVLAGQGKDFTSVLPRLGIVALAGYRLLPAAQMLYGQASQLFTMRHALDEVYDEFRAAAQLGQSEREIASRATGFETSEPMNWSNEIRFKSVSFRYPGSPTPVIHRLDLTIPKNKSLAVIGPTGSGKSTLIDLLLGLHQPTAGRIVVDEIELSTDHLAAWRAGVGYVPQDIFLTDDTLLKNVAFGVDEKRIDLERVREVCRIAQIADFIEQELSEGYQTVVGERGTRLSGGQKQRVGLARALYHQPSLLVLDEATSALDQETEAAIVRAIDRLSGRLTLVVIAHRLSTIEHCDLQLEMKGDRLEPALTPTVS